MANSMRKYSKRYQGREHCFDPWKLMPETFDLAEESQCLDFTQRVRSENSSKLSWILKISRYSHNGEGLMLLDAASALNIANEPQACPFKNKVIAQRYIENPLLINNQKFDFRAYLVVASMDPLLLLYHDGYVKFSLEQYNLTSMDPAVHLTNTNVAKERVKDLEEAENLMQEQSWSFEKFAKHMKKKHSTRSGWMEEFRARIKEVMLHSVLMNLDRLLHHPRVFEMFGFDFILDEDLHVWYLETNLTPSISASSDEKKEVNTRMIKKLIDIQYAFLYNVSVDEVIKTSDFEWIYDERKLGIDRYCGLISEECV